LLAEFVQRNLALVMAFSTIWVLVHYGEIADVEPTSLEWRRLNAPTIMFSR
jgi:hypothetical protein